MRSSRARRLSGCAVAALIVGAGALPGASGVAADAGSGTPSPASASGAAVTVGGRTQPPRLAIKRHGYYHNVSVHNLLWSDWGQASATGRGVFTFQFCVHESCSVSPFFDEPVLVTLGGIKPCGGGRLSYTTLALDIEASMPDSSFTHFQTSLASCLRRGSRGH